MNTLSQKITRWLGSPLFLYIVLGFFVFEALWFVFSAAYPMAFDEDFHFGIIQIYAHQWSPFLDGQPANANQFGALSVDPSYLFHYLLSFPLRFISLFTSSEVVQVILLRLLNVGLFVGSLVLFRKVMLRAGASRALSTVSLAIFALIPIAPQLAAHINYDNLLMLLVAWLCLVVFRLVDGFRQRRIDMVALLTFVVLCLFTSIVKYAALPLLAGAVTFVLLMGYRNFKGHFRALPKQLRGTFVRLSRRAKLILAGLLLVSTGLFAQRYVTNLVAYHTPVPDCGQVLTVEQCSEYGPWRRDYKLAASKAADFQPNVAYYMGQWLLGMRHRLFFAVSGANSRFENYNGLPAPIIAFTTLFAVSLVVTIVWFRRIFTNSYLLFFGLLMGLYVLVLWWQQYSMYKDTSVPVAINGRYLLPVLLLCAVIAGRGISLAMARFKLQQYKSMLAVLAILLFLHGGGIATYILRSNDKWYWPNSTVRKVNGGIRSVLKPLTLQGDKDAEQL